LNESDEEINIKNNHNNKIDINKKSLNINLNKKINEIQKKGKDKESLLNNKKENDIKSLIEDKKKEEENKELLIEEKKEKDSLISNKKEEEKKEENNKEINDNINNKRKIHHFKCNNQINKSKSLNEINYNYYNNFSYISTLENKNQKLNKSFNDTKKKLKINLNKSKNNKIRDINSSYTSKSFISQVKKCSEIINLTKLEIDNLKRELTKKINKTRSFNMKKNFYLSFDSQYYNSICKTFIYNNNYNNSLLKKENLSEGKKIKKENKKINNKIKKEKKNETLKTLKEKLKNEKLKKQKIELKKINRKIERDNNLINNNVIKFSINKKKFNQIKQKKSQSNKNNLVNLKYYTDKLKINEYNKKSKSQNQLIKLRNKNIISKSIKEDDEDYSQLKTNSKTNNIMKTTKTSFKHNNNIHSQSEVKNKKIQKSLLYNNEIINESNEIDLSLRNKNSKIGIKLIKKPYQNLTNNIKYKNNNKHISLVIPHKNFTQIEEKKKINKINNGKNFGYKYWKENQMKFNKILKERYIKKNLINSNSQPLFFSNNSEFENSNNSISNKILKNANINNYNNYNYTINKNEFIELMKSPYNPYSINWTDKILGKNFNKTIKINGTLNGIPKLEIINKKNNKEKSNNLSSRINNKFPSIFKYFND